MGEPMHRDRFAHRGWPPTNDKLCGNGASAASEAIADVVAVDAEEAGGSGDVAIAWA